MPKTTAIKYTIKCNSSDDEITKLLKNELTWIKKAQEEMNPCDLPCPRCGYAMNPNMIKNAESRFEDIQICSDCGMQEALSKEKHQLKNWAIKGLLN
jgi:hypothetical protein